MNKSSVKNMQNQLWEKKPFPTTEYILYEIVKELRELNENLKNLSKR